MVLPTSLGPVLTPGHVSKTESKTSLKTKTPQVLNPSKRSIKFQKGTTLFIHSIQGQKSTHQFNPSRPYLSFPQEDFSDSPTEK